MEESVERAYGILNTYTDYGHLLVEGEHKHAVEEMAKAFNTLDEHLRKGGNLPLSWRNANQDIKE